MYSRQRPSPKYSRTKYWLKVEVQRSAACLPRPIFSSTGGGAIAGEFAHATRDYAYGLGAAGAGGPVLLAPGTIGSCPTNPNARPWADPSLTIGERFRALV